MLHGFLGVTEGSGFVASGLQFSVRIFRCIGAKNFGFQFLGLGVDIDALQLQQPWK